MEWTKTLLQVLPLIFPWNQSKEDWSRYLPVELIEQVIGYLLEERDSNLARAMFISATLQPTLRSAALLSRTWNAVATKHLYSEIYLSSSKSMEILADTLAKNEDIRPLVFQFYFKGKIYGSGTFLLQSTAKDTFNQHRVFSLCPNLMALVGARPWTTKSCSANDIIVSKFNDVQVGRLTHMELSVSNDAFFGGRMIFPPSVEFPVLQDLYMSITQRSYRGEITSDTPQWFKMPQLRCLKLIDVRNNIWGKRLTFPEHSSRINTIELLQGIYTFSNLFNPQHSPLLPYAKSLETLTITAKRVKLYFPPMKCRPCWNFAFLTNLVQLCFPIRSFLMAEVIGYPPCLKHLILVGYLWERYHSRYVWYIRPALSDLYAHKIQGRAVHDKDKARNDNDLRAKVDPEDADVEEKVGVGSLYSDEDMKLDKYYIKLKTMFPI